MRFSDKDYLEADYWFCGKVYSESLWHEFAICVAWGILVGGEPVEVELKIVV